MNKKINIALIALLTFGAGVVSAETNDGMVVCTADAMVCPDGTSVGRTGPNCEFVCGGTTAGTITSNIPAFTAEDKMRGWYYGDKNQKKPGTPADWLVRNAGTRSAQWYNPGITAEKSINTTNLPPKPTIGVPPVPRPGTSNVGAVTTSREEMEARAKALRASTTIATQKIKDEVQKKRIEVARKHTELVNKRLEAAIDRVQKLSDRVSEKLNSLEKEGVNVSISRSHIAEAKTKLDDALTKVAAVKLAVEAIFANTDQKDTVKYVQTLVKDATTAIKDAHSSVAKAISSVKPGINKQMPATTTTGIPSTGATTTQ